MKGNVTKIGKILFISVLLVALLSSCSSRMFDFAKRDYARGIVKKEYNGKEIVSIERIDHDINSYADDPNYLKITEGQKLILSSGEIYSFADHRGDSEEYNYELEFAYDTALNKEIIDMLYSAGLFDLEPTYEGMRNGHDFSVWTLTITYIDGTTMVSKGENLKPDIFRTAGYAFYNITGGEFLYSPYGEYKDPSPIDPTITYKDGKNIFSNGYIGVSAYKSVWREHQRPINDNSIVEFEMIPGYDYTISVSIQSYYDQFRSAKVYAYTDDYDNMKEVEFEIEKSFRLFNEPKASLSFNAEPDTNYVIYLEFKLGNAEYIISTVSVDKE